MNIGEIIKAARVAKGLTLRQVEEATGISNPYLSQLENGKITAPGFNVVHKLGTLFEISFEEMFSGKKDQPESSWTELDVYISMLGDKEKEDLLAYAKFLLWTKTSITPDCKPNK